MGFYMALLLVTGKRAQLLVRLLVVDWGLE